MEDQHTVDVGKGANMTENEPMTTEILRQIQGIQSEIKTIGQALQTLVRVEERQAAAQQSLDRYGVIFGEQAAEISRLNRDLTDLRREGAGRKEIHTLWVLVSVLAGSSGWLVQQVLSA